MYGYVSSYSVQTGEGVISGDDGRRYSFTSRDWNGPEVPRQDVRVDFAPTNGNATSIYPVGSATGRRDDGPSAFPAIAAGCGVGCVLLCLGVYPVSRHWNWLDRDFVSRFGNRERSRGTDAHRIGDRFGSWLFSL